MPPTVELSEKIVAGWRTGDVEGPAGPVLGAYVESEITMTGPGQSGRCGTECTRSRPTIFCC
ncbi:DUF6229 family protein [Rhizohabitans arisaemae]|uniref:DUF6229 family protein n=1 Tax=Rhizohabitans arisaemae TaxID=2720610 RepID=UPI0024B216B0|nr:DUF6229 family protein [Rhizohabitans arisaemae]